MRWIIVCVVLAGCMAEPPEPEVVVSGVPSGEVRGADEAWIIHVTGRQSQDPDVNYMCSIAFAFDLDEESQTIHYTPDPQINDVSPEPQFIWAREVFGAGDCPVHYGLLDDPTIALDMEAFGALDASIQADGTIEVAGHRMQPGQTMTIQGRAIEDRTRYEAELQITIIGAWPHGNITAA